MQTNHRFDHAYAVVRVDTFAGPEVAWENKVTIKEILWSDEDARREVERLNQINAGKGCCYFWQVTRLEKLANKKDLAAAIAAKDEQLP
jgi:hypothetical protein